MERKIVIVVIAVVALSACTSNATYRIIEPDDGYQYYCPISKCERV